MKKFTNFIGELFYDLTDYTMIILVLVIIVGVLFWRFNALFNLSIDKEMIKDPVTISEGDKNKDDSDSSLISDSNNMPNKDDSNDGSTDSDADKTDSSSSSSESSSTNSNTDSTSDDDEDNPNDSNSSNSSEESDSGNQDVSVNIDVKFTIPTGTFPSQIADILIENRLIDDKQKFLSRCVELGLDTKLKAGDFTINTSSSLDDIIYRLAK